jgi:hypothetical protein
MSGFYNRLVHLRDNTGVKLDTELLLNSTELLGDILIMRGLF